MLEVEYTGKCEVAIDAELVNVVVVVVLLSCYVLCISRYLIKLPM